MTARAAALVADGGPTVAAYGTRDRVRDAIRRAFPRRRGHVQACRTAGELGVAFNRLLVDLVVVDVAGPTDDTWKAAAMAADYPCAAFFAWTPLRVSDAAAVARCAALGDVDRRDDGV